MTCGLQTTRWKLALGAVVVCELLKHFALISLGQQQPWGDSPGYWQLAGQAADGDWWLLASDQATRTPGYPWFLAACRWACGTHALFVAVVLQHALVMATSALTAWLVYRSTGREWLALTAWMGCTCSTARPLYANWLLTESLATWLLTAFALVLCIARGRHAARWLTVAAGLLGAGVLVRPALLAAVPAVLIAAWWTWRDGPRTRRQAALMLIGPLVFAALLAPWCVRNQRLFNRFALTIFTGRELWKTAFDPWPGGELPIPTDGAGNVVRQRLAGQAVNLQHNWSVSAALARTGLRDHEIDALMEAAARQAIARRPVRFAGRTLARCLTFWYVWEWETDLQHDASPDTFAGQFRTGPHSWQQTMTAALRFTPERQRACMVLWSLATWLGVLALIRDESARRTGLLLALILGGTTVLTAVLEVPLYRYRLVLEPLMLTATVAGGAAVGDHCCRRVRTGDAQRGA